MKKETMQTVGMLAFAVIAGLVVVLLLNHHSAKLPPHATEGDVQVTNGNLPVVNSNSGSSANLQSNTTVGSDGVPVAGQSSTPSTSNLQTTDQLVLSGTGNLQGSGGLQ